MKPRNKTEREIVKFSNMIPELSDKQREWAIKTCISEDDAYKYSDRFSRGCFYLVCTFKGWQVLRYFQVRVKFRFHKMVNEKIYFKECMQQWMKDGKYVFLSKQRTNGYFVDAFSTFGKLEVKTHTVWGYLGDPREIGYDGVYYASVQDRYKYALRDFKEKISVDYIFRSVNANSFNETLMRRNIEMWRTCKYHEAVFDREKMSAVKIVIRHGKSSYLYDSLWWDMLDSIIYLKKDLRNPSIVCPENLREAHDKWLKSADNKKKKMEDRMTKLRLIAEEKMQLRYLEQAAKADEENKKKAEALANVYIARRKQFFDIDIKEGAIDIQVLKSVQEFFEEGKEMGHCVFRNGYYDVNSKPNCLILSAKVNGLRMETIEVNLSDVTIVQCQGHHNINSSYHDAILKLMNDNLWQIESKLSAKTIRTA